MTLDYLQGRRNRGKEEGDFRRVYRDDHLQTALPRNLSANIVYNYKPIVKQMLASLL